MKCFMVLFLILVFPVAGQQGQQQMLSLPKDVAVKLQKMNKNYLLYTPKNYSKTKSSPLIVFLHGSGERGSNILKVAKHGIPKIAPKNPDFPFIGISPQCLKTKKSGWLVEDLNLLLEYVLKTYNVDKKRIYLTGLSMGGAGCWKWAAANPEIFAAVAPICGKANPDSALQFGELPFWVFHGDADPVVKVEHSQVMADAIKKQNGNVTLTIYPGVKHDSWTKTYENPELYKWFLKHSK